MITIEDFKKVEIKVGQVTAAERVTGSDKLLKLTVEVGEEAPRQIIAGIGKTYEPEVLLGQQLAVLVNLEPRSIMGLESQGMVLAASGDAGPVILMPEKPVPSGAVLK